MNEIHDVPQRLGTNGWNFVPYSCEHQGQGLSLTIAGQAEFKTLTNGMQVRICHQLSHQFGIREERKQNH